MKFLIERGYKGYSMSNNAIDAYSQGERPLSKWNKKEVIEVIADELGVSAEDVELKYDYSFYLTQSSWHHTSKFYNKTKFYKVDFDEDDVIINRRGQDKINFQRIAQLKSALESKIKDLEFWKEHSKEDVKIIGKEDDIIELSYPSLFKTNIKFKLQQGETELDILEKVRDKWEQEKQKELEDLSQTILAQKKYLKELEKD